VLGVLDQRATMGSAARTHATRFGADLYTDRVEDLLTQLLPGRRADERRRGLHDGAAT
jgi:hypothetical protein